MLPAAPTPGGEVPPLQPPGRGAVPGSLHTAPGVVLDCSLGTWRCHLTPWPSFCEETCGESGWGLERGHRPGGGQRAAPSPVLCSPAPPHCWAEVSAAPLWPVEPGRDPVGVEGHGPMPTQPLTQRGGPGRSWPRGTTAWGGQAGLWYLWEPWAALGIHLASAALADGACPWGQLCGDHGPLGAVKALSQRWAGVGSVQPHSPPETPPELKTAPVTQNQDFQFTVSTSELCLTRN